MQARCIVVNTSFNTNTIFTSVPINDSSDQLHLKTTHHFIGKVDPFKLHNEIVICKLFQNRIYLYNFKQETFITIV